VIKEAHILTGRRCTLIFGLFLLWPLAGRTQIACNAISVGLDTQRPLQLRISLLSHVHARTTIYKSDLPWGIRDSIILIAAKPNGEHIEQLHMTDDPSTEKISVAPNQILSGTVDLTEAVRDIDVVIRKSDIHLFWAYAPPKELGLPRWCGGWILIPQQKK
jgi:hypothetical protein